jgi:hypothetical protein
VQSRLNESKKPCHAIHENNKNNTMNANSNKRQQLQQQQVWCFNKQQRKGATQPFSSSSSTSMTVSIAAEAAAAANNTNKILDVSNMEVILRGKQWDRAEDPCAKSVIHLLERNEGLVTWLQPKVFCVLALFLWPKHFHGPRCENGCFACRADLWKTRFQPSTSMASTTALYRFGCKSPSGGTSACARGL